MKITEYDNTASVSMTMEEITLICASIAHMNKVLSRGLEFSEAQGTHTEADLEGVRQELERFKTFHAELSAVRENLLTKKITRWVDEELDAIFADEKAGRGSSENEGG